MSVLVCNMACEILVFIVFNTIIETVIYLYWITRHCYHSVVGKQVSGYRSHATLCYRVAELVCSCEATP